MSPSRTPRGPVPTVLAALAAALAAWPGCGDVEFNWQRSGQTGPTPRPGPESRRPGTPARETAAPAPPAAPQPASRPAGTATRPARAPSPGDAAPTADYFQLILFNETVPPTVPRNFMHIRLGRGSAPEVGAVLGRLYCPVGMQGQSRFVIVYGSQQEWQAAAEFVRLIDVAAAPDTGEPAAGPPIEDFQRAVAALMAASRLGAVDRPGLAKAAAAFERIAGSEQAPGELRWAGAMLASDLYARAVFDYARAQQLYMAAAGIAPAGSVEQMNALYQRARTDLANGRKDRADPLFATVVSQFTAYRQSEVYQRCRRALEAK